MRQNEAEFEEKFEQALAAYTDPVGAGHPRVLTARVLGEVEAKQRKRRWLFNPIVIAFEVLALLLIAVLVVPWQHKPETAHISPSPAEAPASPSAPSTTTAFTTHLHALHVRAAIAHPESHKLPKLAQFPSPAPLTEQELLLRYFADHAAPEVRQSMAKTQQELNEPLRVTELDIPTLESQIEPDNKP
jgi:hypothetical protein